MAPEDNDKKIRRLEDNPVGRVVSDAAGNRWEWNSLAPDETSRLLRALHNDELEIERSSITRKRRGNSQRRNETDVALDLARQRSHDRPRDSRDAGGGFNPYDNSGKPRRR
jgi:hypothetical protein